MDPTAPKDKQQAPNTNQPLSDPPASPSAWSPIEEPVSGGPQAASQDENGPILPGQFVITEENTLNPNEPATNESSLRGNTQPTSPPTVSPASDVQPPPNSPQTTIPNPPQSNSLPPIDSQITPPSFGAQISPNPTGEPAVQNPAVSQSQPDPTPFMPPAPGVPGSNFTKPPGAAIKKLRILIIIVGIIILILIIGTVVWFLFLGSKPNEATKTEGTETQAPSVEQTPVPPRLQGGFNDLENLATSSGQLQESTAAASGSPTP